MGVERHILVWHGVGRDMNGWGVKSKAWVNQTQVYRRIPPVWILLRYALSPQSLLSLSVCILMSTTLSVWICTDETVILSPSCPCVKLSTAPTKAH